MIVPDVNVLVPLHRPGHVHHATARAWWEAFTANDEPMTVPDIIWAGFVRVVTHPRVLRPASSLEDAWRFVDAMTSRGGYAHYLSHPRVMEIFAAQCQEARATANLVTDAYIASVAISLGATLVTFDRDFRRFDDLRVLELA